MLPTVAIVGRPNVGKSSLLNILAGRRISIVDDLAGVTRDRVSTVIELPPAQDKSPARWCELVDTGGYGVYSGDAEQSVLTPSIESQIERAVREAKLILFVVDTQTGITPLDKTFASVLRKQATDPTRIMLIANKSDHPEMDPQASEAMSLGFGEPFCFSATTGRGKIELRERIADRLDFEAEVAPPSPSTMLMAIVGKRNAGKSTLVNTLAGAERVIASEVEGTTRDSVDVRLEIDGQTITAIDTAGVRKRKAIREDVDYYSLHRALRSIRRADAILFLVDATEPISQVDKRLSSEIVKHHKPCVVILSKWDLVKDRLKLKDFKEYMSDALRGLDFAPVLTLSALENKGVKQAALKAMELHQQASIRISTSDLNQVMQDILERRGPSSKLGTRAKIYYATMVATEPPTIALFVNKPDLFDASYKRYMMNRFREMLPYKNVPIKLLIRPRPRKGDAPEGFHAK